MNRVTLQESEIIELLRCNEPTIVEYLYDNYSAALYGVILKIVRGRREVAEDILQDTFIKIWFNRQQYNEAKASIFTWMLNIARNTAIDKLRSSDFKASLMNHSLSDNVDISATTDSSVYQPENDELIDLQEIIAKLPKEQWQVIHLMYFQGYTQSEIAEEYQIPLGTVKSRARLAIESLRTVYADVIDSPKHKRRSSGGVPPLTIAFIASLIHILKTQSTENFIPSA